MNVYTLMKEAKTIFERFLKSDKIQYQKRRGIQKTTSACCLKKVRDTMGFSLSFRRSRPLLEPKYHTSCDKGYGLQLLCCFLITR